MITAEVKFSKEDLLDLQYPMALVGVDWKTYEEISEELGESTSLHLTYNKGTLTFMPVTEIHEFIINLLHDFIRFAGLALKINVVATGKATLRSKTRSYGVDPDLSYFVSKAEVHRIKNYVASELEMPPDIICEIDIYHPSDDKFEIYSKFGIKEFWQYSGEKLKMYQLQKNGEYLEIERSEELSILTGAVLSEFLRRGQAEEQFRVLSDFQSWLQENK